MADVMPSMALEKKKIEVTIDEMELSVKRSDLRILELDDEKSRIQKNINASRKEIDKQRIAYGKIKSEK